MKRFLGVLVASMFLASAGYVSAASKDDKPAKSEKAEATEKGTKTKKSETKAKSAETKAGAMGEKQAGEKKGGQTAEEQKKSTK